MAMNTTQQDDWFSQNAPPQGQQAPLVSMPQGWGADPGSWYESGGITGYGGNMWTPNGPPATSGQSNGAVNWGDLQSRLNPTTDIGQWVRDAFQAQGKTASDTDINYWTGKWNEFGKNDPGYFFQKFSTPDTGGQGGSGGMGGTGSLINKLPTAADLQANPGFQYAIDEAQRGMQNSAAAKGTLLNGRTNQAMTQNLANYALGNFYMPLANLGLQYNQANVGNLYNLANLGLSGSSVGGQ